MKYKTLEELKAKVEWEGLEYFLLNYVDIDDLSLFPNLMAKVIEYRRLHGEIERLIS